MRVGWMGKDYRVERALLQQLRGAVARADGHALIAALGQQVPADVLQLVGDGIVAALAADVPGASHLADDCALALRAREWTGDEELAVELEAAMGRRPWPPLRALGVDLEELSEVLDAGTGEDGGLVDLESGEVWPAVAIEYATESDEAHPDFDDPDRWLSVDPEGSRAGYEDMADFIATVSDRVTSERLAKSIAGKGAFRRFKDALSRSPAEEGRWYRFSEERRRGRARRWLTDAGYRTDVGRPRIT